MSDLVTEIEEVCPDCGSTEVINAHAEADLAYPETFYKFCLDCEHQWGHE